MQVPPKWKTQLGVIYTLLGLELQKKTNDYNSTLLMLSHPPKQNRNRNQMINVTYAIQSSLVKARHAGIDDSERRGLMRRRSMIKLWRVTHTKARSE